MKLEALLMAGPDSYIAFHFSSIAPSMLLSVALFAHQRGAKPCGDTLPGLVQLTILFLANDSLKSLSTFFSSPPL